MRKSSEGPYRERLLHARMRSLFHLMLWFLWGALSKFSITWHAWLTWKSLREARKMQYAIEHSIHASIHLDRGQKLVTNQILGTSMYKLFWLCVSCCWQQDGMIPEQVQETDMLPGMKLIWSTLGLKKSSACPCTHWSQFVRIQAMMNACLDFCSSHKEHSHVTCMLFENKLMAQ